MVPAELAIDFGQIAAVVRQLSILTEQFSPEKRGFVPEVETQVDL
jgi:hypothetical protein